MKRRDFLAAAAGSMVGSAAVSAKGENKQIDYAHRAVATAGLTNAEIGRAFRIANRYRGTYLAWRAGRIVLVSNWNTLPVQPIVTLNARLIARGVTVAKPVAPQWNLTDAELGWAWVVAKRPQRIGAGWTTVLQSSADGEAYIVLMPNAQDGEADVPVKPVATLHERLADTQRGLQEMIYGGVGA